MVSISCFSSGTSGRSKSEAPRESKSEPSEAGPIWERKKDAADVQLSRLLRKPRKRNEAEFF